MPGGGLWPVAPERVALGDGSGSSFALRLPAEQAVGHRPVLLVHGFRGSAVEWGPLAHRLSRARDVWAPELAVDPAAPPDGLRAVQALLDRCRAAAGGDVDVVASSMGGFVTTAWAAGSGRDVASMTLLAPALVPLQPAWRVPGVTRLIGLSRLLDLDERQWESRLRAASADDWLADSGPHHLAIPAPWRQALLDHDRATATDGAAAGRGRARQDALRGLLATLRRRAGVERLLDRVGIRVLWLHGDVDGLVPYAASRQRAGSWDRCTFETLAGIGHVPHLECPDAVASRVEEWTAG